MPLWDVMLLVVAVWLVLDVLIIGLALVNHRRRKQTLSRTERQLPTGPARRSR